MFAAGCSLPEAGANDFFTFAVNLYPPSAATRAEVVTAGRLMLWAANKAKLLGHHLANQVANMTANKNPKYLTSFAI